MGRLNCLAIMSISLVTAFARSTEAQCVTSVTAQSKYTMPKLTGHLAYQSAVPGSPSTLSPTSLYLVTLPTGQPRQVSSDWGLYATLNPSFSSDGKWITFAGVQFDGTTYYHDVYVWNIDSTNQPINLTNGKGATRSEDPRFTDDKQYILVFKQDGNIKRMVLEKNAKGDLYAASVQSVTNGGIVNGSYNEASAPVLSIDGESVYYFRGKPSSMQYPSRVYETTLRTLREQVVSLSSLNAAYYPNVSYQSVSNMLYYVGHNQQQGTYDQIYLQRGSATPLYITVNQCGVDNSDPAPVDPDLLIFSKDSPGSSPNLYELYLGNINTSMVWNLSLWGIRSNGNNLEGAAYTAQ